MDIDNIKARYENLNHDLKKALATMERTDRVILIRDAIKDLQNMCPHSNGSFDFSDSESCPYCGKKFGK